MFGKILSVLLRGVGVVLFLSGVGDFVDWFRNTDLTMNHLRIATLLWFSIAILAFVLGHSIGRMKNARRVLVRIIFQFVGVVALVSIGWVIVRIYPREISLSVK